MKGIVFTEFLDMVDDKFGPVTTESIIDASDLASGGAYTSVGTYDHSEIVALVSNLSKTSGLEVSVLIYTFGHHLLGRFTKLFPDFFAENDTVDSFLEKVDGYIHGEVLRLYPDAKLPKITTTRIPGDCLELHYQSDRMMGDLAEGMIVSAIEHFGATHVLKREDLENEGEAQCVKFTLTKRL